MVGGDVREVESEIDRCIRELAIWAVKKDVLLRRLMTIWRDGLELAQMMFAHGLMFGAEEACKSALASEHLIMTGAYQAIKWAMEYAGEHGADEVSDESLTDLVMNVGAPYQLLVDSLKLGLNGLAEFSVDCGAKTLTIYEGGEVSGHDASIVLTDHSTVPFHKQSPLVDDADQLTRRWAAGEYRQYWRWLQSMVEPAETETIVGQAGPLAPKLEIMKRPVVVEIPKPPTAVDKVQQDLALTTAKCKSPMKWKIDSWHDCPLVQIGDKVFGVSAALLALAGFDDYMLRVALLNDSEQYEKVSGLREDRMIEICREAFEQSNWTFTPHFLLRNPENEIDVFATKDSDKVIVQLKSTLRPQSPWEVYKRNSDVIGGIEHTARMIARIDGATAGFVITDGYEGDYATWKQSLATGVPVATLDDLDWIVQNPPGAFKELAERAGVGKSSQSSGLSERTASLCGWTLRLRDQTKPKES